MQNGIIHGLPSLSQPVAPVPADPVPSTADETSARERFPHQRLYRAKYKFERSGEPPVDDAEEAEEPNPYITADDHWTQANRPPWEQHSRLGPNVNAETRIMHFESPLEAVVNKVDYDYTANRYKVCLASARAVWEQVREASNVYSNTSLDRSKLRDPYQQLFLDIV